MQKLKLTDKNLRYFAIAGVMVGLLTGCIILRVILHALDANSNGVYTIGCVESPQGHPNIDEWESNIEGKRYFCRKLK